jgi:uncharacterized coiled-coil protein SlyX
VSINSLIKESVDPKVQEISQELDKLKKQRLGYIIKMKELQHKLYYKTTEQEAISKLIEIEKKKPRHDNIGKLKRMQRSLEFKISTESMNLQQEKMTVMKINEISSKIDAAMKLTRLERKSSLISGDIVGYNAALAENAKAITEVDYKLDALYSNVRKILGVSRYKPKQATKPKPQPKVQQDINLEDIVVIKKKESKQQPEQSKNSDEASK